MSYADKILAADGKDAIIKAMQEALSHYSWAINMLVNGVPFDDLPILMAAMQMAAQSLRPLIGESGCGLMDEIMARTKALAINTAGLRKERGE